MHLEFGQTLGHCAPGAGEERRADAVGGGAQAQIEAGGLDLFGMDRGGGSNRPRLDQGAQALRRQNTAVGHQANSLRHQPLETIPPAEPRARRAVSVMVGPERFELSTSRPPDGRANQAALRPDTGPT